jgi:hypothetical protein
VLQLGAAAAVVLVLAVVGGGRYPLPVDLMVYAAAGLAAATAVRQLAERAERRRLAPDPVDRPDPVSRAQALTEAVDWVITARPREDFHGRTLTPEMVQREALMRSGLEVETDEAARALAERLRFRGYLT